MKLITVFVASVSCIIALSGCALQSDMESLNERIFLLEQRNMELEEFNAASKREIKTRFDSYSKTREEKERDLRDQSAGLQATFEKIREDIQDIRGRVEESDYLLQRKIESIENSEKELKTNLRELEKQLKTGAFSRTTSDNSPQSHYSGIPSEPPVSPNSGTFGGDRKEENFSDTELYNMAKQAFDRNDFQKARSTFERLLDTYSDSRHADNAQFWIGEISYKEKNYERAILEYETVIEKYPNGNKIKAALLKQGFSFFNIGDKANARLLLQELVDKYPDSHEAKLARDKLEWF